MDTSANSSLQPTLTFCFESRTSRWIFTALLMANVFLLLPLLFFIIYLGVQQWRKQRSAATAATVSHTDFFTYNMVALELISMFASCLYCFGDYMGGKRLQAFGNSVYYLTSPGQTLVHLLTCVERYLAVVHPIAYLRLRHSGGLRIRNLTTGCVWLLISGLMLLSNVVRSIFLTVTNSCIMVFSLVFVTFFSFSVLHVLKDPGPGQVGGHQRVDQPKHKAFHTIMSIMVAELFRLVGVLVCSVTFDASLLSDVTCTVGSAAIFLAVPCGLVLPVLFLQKAGKLPCCKDSADSANGQIKAAPSTFNPSACTRMGGAAMVT